MIITADILTVNVTAAGSNPGGQQREIEIPESLKVLGNDEKKPEGAMIFRVINQKDGDKRIVWDSKQFPEIHDAKTMFDKLVKEGLVPYKVGLKGKRTTEVMKVFDPFAEEVIFAPIQALAGG